MKSGFILLTGIDEKHNEVHRKAFLTPETIYISQTEPTVDSLQLGEPRIYKSGADFYLYCKLTKTQIGRMQFTLL
jgi:hypothetical protein